MNLEIKKILIENFKGIQKLEVDFNNGVTKICGENAVGKTSVFDAICWLFFGKDSYDREKFNIRPLDSNGEKVHHIEISVSAEISVDGKTMKLSKIQKENWVKARGSENPELKGNVNVCEINGFPKSDSEYRKEISEIVDEDMFKMLTSPAHFPSLAWKEQRKILMNFVGDMSDAELAKSIGGYDDLMADLEYAGTDDIQKKYAKQIKELKEKAAEIPVRIDEINKNRVYIDTEALTNKKNGLQGQLAEIEKQLSSRSTDTSDLDKELSEIKTKISDFEESVNECVRKDRDVIKTDISALMDSMRSNKYEKGLAHDEIVCAKRKFENNESLLETTKQAYTKAKESTFPEDEWVFDGRSTICKTCGRLLDPDKVEEIKADFEKRKADAIAEFEKVRQENIKKFSEDGKRLVTENEDLGKAIKQAEEKITTADEQIAKIESEIADLESRLESMSDSPDFGSYDEWNALNDKKVKIEEEIAKMMINDGDTSELEVRRDALKIEIEDLTRDIASASRNEDIDSRIDELEKEMKEVQQKIADAERMSFLLENFVKTKMETVSDVINSKFDLCNFKLFETQINGGVRECCELTFNGVPFSTLNSGHRIVCGIDIIKSLQKLLGTKVPIWIDNSETVNSYNMPDVDCQMVLLQVTDDKKLRFM